MAGTRLLIHAVFLMELLLLVTLAAYLGLCRPDDLVCRKYILGILQPSSSDAWAVTMEGSSTLFEPLVDIAPVVFTCADSQVVFWNDTLRQLVQDLDHSIVVQSHANLRRVCEESQRLWTGEADGNRNDAIFELLKEEDDSDVWICESIEPPDKARMIIVNFTTILHAANLSQRMKDLEQLYPRQVGESTTRRKLTVTVHVGLYRRDWKLWMQAVDALLSEWQSNMPCLDRSSSTQGGLRIEWSYMDLSEFAQVTKGQNDNETVFRMAVSEVPSMMEASSSRNDDSSFRIDLFLPSMLPTVFVDKKEASTLMSLTSEHILAVVERPASSDQEYLEVANAALQPALTRFLSACMGVPDDNLSSIVDMENLDASDTVQLWVDALASIELTRELVKDSGSFPQALDHLDDARVKLDLLRKDPELLEPLDFPPDQYLAIFAPLLLPLLIPLLFGLVREVKRYRKLRAAKKAVGLEKQSEKPPANSSTPSSRLASS